MPLKGDAMEVLSGDQKEDTLQQLRTASQGLSGKQLEVASSLGRSAIGRDNVSLRGGLPGPSTGFPAPHSRR